MTDRRDVEEENERMTAPLQRSTPYSTYQRLVGVLIFVGVLVTLSNIELTQKIVTSTTIGSLKSTRMRRPTPSLMDVMQDQTKHQLDVNEGGYDLEATRGMILPLFDAIAPLGISLIMELRTLNVDLPIEIPHCGDLGDETQALLHSKDKDIRIYDICALAAADKRFCKDLKHCQNRFRAFEIKILAMVFSKFQEIMLVDADTLFFQDPMKLWETEKYKRTGTLFFHDRISCEKEFLAQRVKGKEDISVLHQYLSKFDVSKFQSYPTLPRNGSSVLPNNLPLPLHFQPSDFLLSSHSWNLRAGHQMDSSLLFWHKGKQPRATAILESFIALHGPGRPPSYGDKEFYFIACELAETQYEVSDFGVGSVGWDVKEEGTVLCGDAIHYFPEASAIPNHGSGLIDPPVLYMNSDNIVKWNPLDKPLLRTKARLGSFYAGSFVTRRLPQECPFDVTVVNLTQQEIGAILQRQKYHNALVNA